MLSEPPTQAAGNGGCRLPGAPFNRCRLSEPGLAGGACPRPGSTAAGRGGACSPQTPEVPPRVRGALPPTCCPPSHLTPSAAALPGQKGAVRERRGGRASGASEAFCPNQPNPSFPTTSRPSAAPRPRTEGSVPSHASGMQSGRLWAAGGGGALGEFGHTGNPVWMQFTEMKLLHRILLLFQIGMLLQLTKHTMHILETDRNRICLN